MLTESSLVVLEPILLSFKSNDTSLISAAIILTQILFSQNAVGKVPFHFILFFCDCCNTNCKQRSQWEW